MTVRVSIVGASGYVGGELIRLLLRHPHVEIVQVTSQSQAGSFIYGTHPNLRGATKLKFVTVDDLQPVDLLFLALPHGEAAGKIEKWAGLAERVIDLSADFRLKDTEVYAKWYGKPHPNPEWLAKFVYGLPELHREELKTARYVSGVGCNATATNLALLPFARAGLIERVVVEVKVGSSEGGNKPSLATHHPERVNVVRSFAPVGHRHQAEIQQEIGPFELHFSATAVDLIRGVLCTAHVFLKEKLSDPEIWKLYRQAYQQERFVRIIKDKGGVYRYPEPKILAGSNYCDVGFESDPTSNRVVAISAIDNLMKGAAGSAVQSMNLMLGFPEDMGLEFLGLHP